MTLSFPGKCYARSYIALAFSRFLKLKGRAVNTKPFFHLQQINFTKQEKFKFFFLHMAVKVLYDVNGKGMQLEKLDFIEANE